MLTLMLPGDRHRGVAVLQRALNELPNASPLPVDGFYSQFVRGRVAKFQQSQGLQADGIVGRNTIDRLGLDLKPTKLKEADFTWAAKRLEVHTAMVHAFVEVESRGSGYLSNGIDPIILFERHYFWRNIAIPRKDGQTKAGQLQLRDEIHAEHPDICSSKVLTNKKTDSNGRPISRQNRYLGGSAEWERLNRARGYSDTAGLMSVSWGMFQIMGEHAIRLGYTDVQQMVRCMQASELDQLDAFCRFVEADSRLLRALQNEDFEKAAEIYNGRGYKTFSYDTKLAASFKRWGG